MKTTVVLALLAAVFAAACSSRYVQEPSGCRDRETGRYVSATLCQW